MGWQDNPSRRVRIVRAGADPLFVGAATAAGLLTPDPAYARRFRNDLNAAEFVRAWQLTLQALDVEAEITAEPYPAIPESNHERTDP